jgi:hypothetical protein
MKTRTVSPRELSPKRGLHAEAYVEKPPWKVVAVLDDDTVETFARNLERALNKLEEDGYEVDDPKPVGKHYFVCGRLPRIVLQEKS